MELFGCMHKIFESVMGIIKKQTNDSSLSQEESFSLTKQEIEILLNMIRNTSFLGEHVEPIYNMVLKLQKQYLNIKN
jgi:hypothetical protein